MIENYLRPTYQRFFMDPVAKLLMRFPQITPNKVTTLSVVAGVIAAVLFILHWNYAAVVLLILSGMSDSLDGTLARVTGDISDVGAAWDIVGDRIVELAVFVSFYFYNPSRNGLAALLMLGASYLCITSFLVVGIFSQNQSHKSFFYSIGLIERLEAFVFFIVMMLFPTTIVWLAWVYAVLVFYTAAIRMIEFRRSYMNGAI
jgi:phosphatidylglycerophosphate synthase